MYDIEGSMENGSVTLSVETDATSEQLWASWQNARTHVERAGQRMIEAGERWKQATDPEAAERLWAEREIAARQYRLLEAWKDVFYAAYILTTDGAVAGHSGAICWLVRVVSPPAS